MFKQALYVTGKALKFVFLNRWEELRGIWIVAFLVGAIGGMFFGLPAYIAHAECEDMRALNGSETEIRHLTCYVKDGDRWIDAERVQTNHVRTD